MIALRLEVFETADDATVVTDRAALEDARREAFDEGFAAGRAAALAEAQSAQQTAERAAMQALSDLSFTFHEARAHVLAALSPLFEQIAAPLLPAIARETLAPMVAEALMPLAAGLAEAPVRLSHHPSVGDAMARLDTPLPVTLHADPALAEGEVHLRLGEVETRIDLTRATHDITAALGGFFQLSAQDRKYG